MSFITSVDLRSEGCEFMKVGELEELRMLRTSEHLKQPTLWELLVATDET